MKFRFPLIAAFAALLALAGCGGNTDDGKSAVAEFNDPKALETIELVVGTGDEAVTGKTLTLEYSLWLYDNRLTENKGAFLEGGPFGFTTGSKQVITGFEEGILGMKVGGKRRIFIPSNKAYGKDGSTAVPPNWGLTYEITLKAVATPTTTG